MFIQVHPGLFRPVINKRDTDCMLFLHLINPLTSAFSEMLQQPCLEKMKIKSWFIFQTPPEQLYTSVVLCPHPFINNLHEHKYLIQQIYLKIKANKTTYNAKKHFG